MAQAKRSDGGVLKVEQHGGPLAMEEFDRIKRIEKQIPPATVSLEEFVSIINGNYCLLPILCYFTRTLASRNSLALGNA